MAQAHHFVLLVPQWAVALKMTSAIGLIEWQMCPEGPRCQFQWTATKKVYKYVSNEFEYPALLHICNEKVSFQMLATSNFHGYAFTRGNAMHMKFHRDGICDLAKKVVLLKLEEGKYVGKDSAGREVTMTFYGNYQFCTSCGVGHPI